MQDDFPDALLGGDAEECEREARKGRYDAAATRISPRVFGSVQGFLSTKLFMRTEDADTARIEIDCTRPENGSGTNQRKDSE